MEGLDPTSSKRKVQRFRCQVREHRGHKKQGKDISVEVMEMHPIHYGLDGHDQPVHDAGPNGERDQAEMVAWIACREEQEHAQSRVNGDDHLEVLGSPKVWRVLIEENWDGDTQADP